MRASPVIVGEVAGQNAAQVAFAENQNVIQTLAPDRADEPLREGILPRAVRGREDFLDPHALHSVPKLFAVDLVAVAQEIGGRGVVRKGIHDLLGGPVGGGMLGHVEVDDAPAVVREHDKNKEDAQARGGHREEIEGDQIADMVGEERPPGLRRQGAPLRYEPRDGALGDVEPQPETFPVNSRGAPQRIGRSHRCDESLDLNIDGWAARDGPGGELGPVLAEAAPLPPQDGVGRHDDESLPPARPHPRQRDPEESVAPAHLRPSHRPLVDGELVAQGQVLQGDKAVSAAERGKQWKQAEQAGDHRARIFSGSAPPDQSLGAGRGFGEGQARSTVCSPAVCGDLFGQKFATTNYGLLYTAKCTASLLGPFGNVLQEATGSWFPIFGVAIVFDLGAALLAFAVLRRLHNSHVESSIRAAPSAAGTVPVAAGGSKERGSVYSGEGFCSPRAERAWRTA